MMNPHLEHGLRKATWNDLGSAPDLGYDGFDDKEIVTSFPERKSHSHSYGDSGALRMRFFINLLAIHSQ